MERVGESSFDTIELAEQGPELGRKNRSAITDDRVRKAVILHHYVDNYFCQSWGIDGDHDWLIIHHFREPVNVD